MWSMPRILSRYQKRYAPVAYATEYATTLELSTKDLITDPYCNLFVNTRQGAGIPRAFSLARAEDTVAALEDDDEADKLHVSAMTIDIQCTKNAINNLLPATCATATP